MKYNSTLLDHDTDLITAAIGIGTAVIPYTLYETRLVAKGGGGGLLALYGIFICKPVCLLVEMTRYVCQCCK